MASGFIIKNITPHLPKIPTPTSRPEAVAPLPSNVPPETQKTLQYLGESINRNNGLVFNMDRYTLSSFVSEHLDYLKRLGVEKLYMGFVPASAQADLQAALDANDTTRVENLLSERCNTGDASHPYFSEGERSHLAQLMLKAHQLGLNVVGVSPDYEPPPTGYLPKATDGQNTWRCDEREVEAQSVFNAISRDQQTTPAKYVLIAPWEVTLFTSTNSDRVIGQTDKGIPLLGSALGVESFRFDCNLDLVHRDDRAALTRRLAEGSVLYHPYFRFEKIPPSSPLGTAAFSEQNGLYPMMDLPQTESLGLRVNGYEGYIIIGAERDPVWTSTATACLAEAER